MKKLFALVLMLGLFLAPIHVYAEAGAELTGSRLRGATVNSDEDWYSANYTNNSGAPIRYTLWIIAGTGTVIELEIDDDAGNTNTVGQLNEGSALIASALYAFDFVIPSGYSFNIQNKTGSAITAWIVTSRDLNV